MPNEVKSILGKSMLEFSKEQVEAITKVNFLKKMGLKDHSSAMYIQHKPDSTNVEVGLNKTTTQLMVVDFCPVIGDQDPVDFDQSPINIAAKEFYVYVRGKNSSLSSYIAADILKQQIAVAGLYMGWNLLYRSLSINSRYSKYNVAFGSMMNKSLTATIPSENTTDIGSYINSMAVLKTKLEALRLMKNIPAINRWFELSSDIYADEDIEQAGLIVFQPNYLPYYDMTPTSTTVGDIRYKNVRGITWESLYNWIASTADKYQNDEDFNNISAEMKKADIPLYELRAPSSDTTVLGNWKPIFNYDIIDGIKNARPFVFDDNGDYGLGIVEDNDGNLVFGYNRSTHKPVGAYRVRAFVDEQWDSGDFGDVRFHEDLGSIRLYSHEESPSAQQLAAYTRWRYLATSKLDGAYVYTYLRGVSTEIVTRVTFVNTDKDDHLRAEFVWPMLKLHLDDGGTDNTYATALVKSLGYVCIPETLVCFMSGTTISEIVPLTGDIDYIGDYNISQAIMISTAVCQAAWGVSDAAGAAIK